MTLGALGISHRTAPVQLRERFHLEGDRLEAVVSELAASPELRECVVLSTCNRTEYYYAAARAEPADRRVLETMAATAGLSLQEVAPHLSRRYDRDAVAHLYRVASGMDSLVIGEHQIQGQVGEAYRRGRNVSGTVGPVLHRLFQSALSTGGRVRSSTRLGEGLASVPSAAVELARKVFGHLEGRRAMVVGTGEMGALTLRSLMDAGVSGALVASRSLARARELTERLGGEPIVHEDFWVRLPEADVLVASTSATRPFLTADRIRAARTGARPLVVLDIAVPRNVEERAGDLPDVFLYNIDDLQRVVDEAREARQGEVTAAEEIVWEETERYWRWYRARLAAPLIRRMRARAEEIRRRELDAALGQVDGLTAEDRERIHMASRLALNKILHEPTHALRDLARRGEGDRLLEVARRLLGLDGDGDDEDGRRGGG